MGVCKSSKASHRGQGGGQGFCGQGSVSLQGAGATYKGWEEERMLASGVAKVDRPELSCPYPPHPRPHTHTRSHSCMRIEHEYAFTRAFTHAHHVQAGQRPVVQRLQRHQHLHRAGLG